MNPINIARQFYTMASKDGKNAEITMYGDIVEERPWDWWENKPAEGNFIVGSEFLEDLKQVEKCSAITIRMDSLGGNAGVALMIHNRLRELANKGVALTCIVDGVAMSGGSIIMCACDKVKVNPASLVMIHKCWTIIWGGYNADELRKIAESNDAYDRAQAKCYVRKTGKTETQILHMMSNTTYMTGEEAKEKGFADEVLDSAEPLEIAASADRRTLFVGQRKMHLAPGMMLPDSIPTVKAGAVPVVTNTNTQEQSEGGKPMASTIEELRAENPDLVAQLVAAERAAERADAIQAEQTRLQEIDDVASLFNPDLVRAAKYGEHACTARDLAYRAAQEAAKNGQQFLSNMNADAKNSGAADVPAAPAPAEEPKAETPEEKMAAARAAVHEVFKKEEK